MGNVYSSPLHDDFNDHNGQINGIETTPVLVVSGNEITDATRATKTQGDGLLNDSSFGIWEAATNLVTNGGFETNTSGWGAVGTGAAISRTTSIAQFGTASLQVTAPNGGTGVQLNSITTTPGASYVLSAWVNAPAGASIAISATDLIQNSTPLSSTTTNGIGAWKRVSLVVNPIGTSTFFRFFTTPGATFYLDGVQFELRRAATTLTTSGNEITDAIRAEGIGVNVVGHSYDGRSGDSSFGIWEAATNLFANGGTETDTNSYFINGTGVTLTRDTSQKKFGTASLKVVTPGSVTNEGVNLGGSVAGNYMACTPGTTYVFSAWVYSVAGGENMKLIFAEYDATPTYINDFASLTQTLIAGWQRVSLVGIPKRGVNMRARIVTNTTASVTFWVDGAQVEARRTATTLTTSGNEITDTLRAEGASTNVVGHSYDGRTNDSSFGIWEAATNLVVNGGFETNTTGWTGLGATTAYARSTTRSKFGGASCSVIRNDNNTGFLGLQQAPQAISITGGATYVFSAWIYNETVANNAFGLYFQQYNGTTPINPPSPYRTGFTITAGTWTRISLTVVAHGLATSASVGVFGLSGANGETWYVDGIQLEQRRAATTLTTSGNELTDVIRAATTTSPTGTLTVSGNEITDATRAAAAALTTTSSGQMIDSNGLLSVSNAAVNSGFEVDVTTGWTSTSGATVTRVTSQSKFGTASAQVVTDGTAPNQGLGYTVAGYIPAVTGVTWTGSIWVNAPAGATLRWFLTERDNTNTTLASQITTFTGTGAWQQVSVTKTLNQATTVNISFHLQTNLTNQALTFYVDGHQVEVGSTTSSTYVDTTNGAKVQNFVVADSSFGFYRGATNLFRRGQCDSTTDWIQRGSGTATRTVDATMPAPFSPQSIKAVCDGTIANQGVGAQSSTGLAAVAGTLGVGSIYFKGVAGQSYTCWIDWINTDASTTQGTTIGFTASGNWQLVTAPSLAVAVGKTGDLLRVNIVQNGVALRPETLWFAHAMLETPPSPYQSVAPYVATSGGTTATHAGSSATITATNTLTQAQGWIATRFTWNNDPGSSDDIWVWLGGGQNIYLQVVGTTIGVHYADGTASLTLNSPATLVSGNTYTVVSYWTSTSIGISVNGAAFTTQAKSSIPTTLPSTVNIGTWSQHELEGSMYWLVTGVGTLTNADATTLGALGNTDPTTTTLGQTAATTAVWSANTSTFSYPSFTTQAQGDGYTFPDSSFGIWEAANNLITNGNFETNTTGWSDNDGFAVLARDTTKAYFGTASLRVTPRAAGGSGCRTNPGISATAGTIYVGSAYIWAAPGQIVSLRAYDATFSVIPNTAGASQTNITGNGTWQRAYYIWTAPRTESNYLFITSGDTSGMAFFVDGAQIEQRVAASTFGITGNEITDASRLGAWSWTTATNNGKVDDKGWYVANYINNPKFQTSISNWLLFGGSSITGGAASWNATGGVGGSGAGQFTGTGGATAAASYAVAMPPGGSGPTLLQLQQYGMPCASGQVIRARASLCLSTLSTGPSPDLTVSVSFFDNSGAALSTLIAATQSNPTIGTFYSISGTVTAPVNAAYAYIRLTCGSVTAIPNGSTFTFLVDNAQILLDSNDTGVSTYVDGDSASPRKFSWWGTSNASVTRAFTGDGSTGIHRAATNLFRRGQCDTTADTGLSAATIATDSTMAAPFSPQSYKITQDGTAGPAGVSFTSNTGLNLAAGTNTVASVWFKGVSGQGYTLSLAITHTDTVDAIGPNTNFTASGDWQLVTLPAYAVTASKIGDKVRLRIFQSAARLNEVFWAAHVMLEANATVAAPYVSTAGGVTSTYGASKMQAPSSLLNATTGWMAFRVRMGFNSTDTANVTTIDNGAATSITLGSWQVDANNRILLTLGQTNGLTTTRDSGGAQTTAGTTITFNKGDVITAIAAWDATSVKLSFNGGAFITGANSAIPNLSTATLVDIGQRTTGAGNLNCDVLWAAFGNGTLTAGDAAALHASGNSDPLTDSVVSSGASIKAMWPAITSAYISPGVTSQTPTPYVNTTRAAARVQEPVASIINNTQSWVAARVRLGFVPGDTLNRYVFSWGIDTGDWLFIRRDSATTRWSVGSSIGGVLQSNASITTASWNVGDYATVVFAYTSTTLKISVNGSAFTSIARSSITNIGDTLFDIGRFSGSNFGWIDSNIMWLATGTGTLTDADAATLNAFGNTDPNIDTLLSTTAAPTSVWSADGTSYLTPGATNRGPTPYVHTDGATQTRAIGKIQPPTSLINTTQGWVALRVRMSLPSSATLPTSFIAMNDGTVNNRLGLVYNSTSGGWATRRVAGGNSGSGASQADSWNAGDLRTVILKWDSTTVGVSTNGAAFSVATNGQTFTPTNFEIGSEQGVASGPFNGEILWAATGTGTLTNADAVTLNSLGNTDPNVDTVLGSTPAITSVWTADSSAYLTPGATLQIATPYVHTDGSTQTRAAARVQAPTSTVSGTQGWFAARVRMGFSQTVESKGGTGFDHITSITDNGNLNGVQLFYREASNDWRMRIVAGGIGNIDAVTAGPAFNAGDLITIIGAWRIQGGVLQTAISVNGSAFTAYSTSTLASFTPTVFDIGSINGTGNWFDGDILWATWGTGTLTDADAATLNALGNTDPNVDATLGTTAATTAVWKANTAAYLTPGATTQIATPYVETNGSTQTRSAARVQAPSSLINPTQGWVAARLRMNWPTGVFDTTGNPTVFHTNSGSNDFLGLYRIGGNQWRFTRRVANVGTNADVVNAFAQGDYVTVIGTWTGSTVSLSVNGSPFVTSTNTTIPSLPTLFDIGNGFTRIDADVLWFTAGTGTLTNADAVTINAFGNTDQSPTAFPGNPTMTWDGKTTTYVADRETTRHHYDLRAFHSTDQTMTFTQNDYNFWHGYQYNSLNVNDTRSLSALAGTESWDTSSGVVTVGKDANYRYSNSIRITVADSSFTDALYGVTQYGATQFGQVVVNFPSTFLTDDILTDFNDPNRAYYLELVLRNFPAQSATPHFDLANCFIDISSTTNFTNATTDSLPFTASLNDVTAGGDTYLRFPFTQLKFADRSSIKAVRFRLRSVGGTSTFIAQAMRVVDDEYTWQQIDVDTKRQQLARSIPRAGGTEPSTVFGDVYFKNEQPKNTTYITQFNSGHNPTGNDNTFRQFFRKQTNGDRIEIKLNARDTQSRLFIIQTLAGVTTTIASTSINTNILTNETSYFLVSELQGTQVRASIYTRSGIGLGSLVYTTGWQTVGLTARGLIGYSFEPYNYDFTIQYIAPQTAEFAVMQTTPFNSRKLVRGATLYPDNSGPINVIDTLTPKAWGDGTVTIDGNNDIVVTRTGTLNQGGVRYEPLQFIGNSAQLVLTGELWTTQAQGTYRAALLDAYDDVEWLAPIPNIVANQWNKFSLNVSPGLLPQLSYLHIQQQGNYSGSFKLRNIQLGYSTISWSVSPDNGTTWQSFMTALGAQYTGAFFATPTTSIKIQAVATTDQGWISGYQLQPQYVY